MQIIYILPWYDFLPLLEHCGKLNYLSKTRGSKDTELFVHAYFAAKVQKLVIHPADYLGNVQIN